MKRYKQLFEKNILTLKDYLSYYNWDKNYPSYKAVINPKNIIEKSLQIHEQIEFKYLQKNNLLNDTINREDYKKAHKIANVAMLKYLKQFDEKKFNYVIEESNLSLIQFDKAIGFVLDIYYPINKLFEFDYLKYKIPKNLDNFVVQLSNYIRGNRGNAKI